MTAAGYTTLENELKHRQQVERPRIIQQITDARTHGDLSENAEYHAAKELQSINEGRIAELEDRLARAEVIDVSKLSGETIKFGATVTLVDEDTAKKQVWQIVGEPEADAKKGKISVTSPLARALIGKTKGANVEVVTPRRRESLRGEEGRMAVSAGSRCGGQSIDRGDQKWPVRVTGRGMGRQHERGFTLRMQPRVVNQSTGAIEMAGPRHRPWNGPAAWTRVPDPPCHRG